MNKLAAALWAILENFDTAASPSEVEVEADGEQVIGKVSEELEVAINHALDVLDEGDYEDEFEDEDADDAEGD